ncbi:MAG TPA: PHB depolymerase family esterase [Candidatus Binatia bacterium]|nr:PHB depolymerase family esterase [Candidatus Binatia bacterium]
MRRRGILIAAGALAFAVAGASGAADVPARPSAGCERTSLATGERLERTIDVGGVARSSIVDAPDALVPGKPVPLLLDFHGLGHSAAGVWGVSGFRALARREPFVTAYPQGLPVRLETPRRVFEGVGWEVRSTTGNRDLGLVARLLDRLEADYCIDRARVYATGFSNGAYLSELIGCAMADRVAAVAPVSGGLPSVRCEPSRPVPILIHHGRLDDIVDVAQGRRARDEWARIDGCSADVVPSPAGTATADGIRCDSAACGGGSVVEMCEGDFAHHWPPSATERIWAFFVGHPMPPPAR